MSALSKTDRLQWVESAMWTIRGDRLLTVLFLTYSQLIYRAATGRSATIGAVSTEHSALRTTS